jgi:hypothetical protein
MAALSIATDLEMGQPLESALCSCVVAMRLGEALGLDDDTMRDVYYQSLLRYIGCNADTYLMAALFGDELALRQASQQFDQSQNRRFAPFVLSLRHCAVPRIARASIRQTGGQRQAGNLYRRRVRGVLFKRMPSTSTAAATVRT